MTHPRRDVARLILLCAGLVLATSALAPAAVAGPGQAVDLVAEPARRRVTLGFSRDDLRLVPTADGCDILLDGATRGRLATESTIEMPRLHLCAWVDTDFELRDLLVARARYELVPADRLPDLSRWLATADRAELIGYPGPTVPTAAPEWAPAAPVTWSRGGLMRGQRLVGLIVHPLRYRVVGDRFEFELLRELEFELQGETGQESPDGLPAARTVPWEWKVRRGLRAATVDLRRHPDAVAPPATPAGDGRDGAIFSPTFRPSADGSPVEYVIVTTAALSQAFQRLADWKTKKGVQTVVRTVEWISVTYPNGVDRAEQLRFFLRDAYLNWGTLWVLLGGDTELVPVRFALSRLGNPVEYIPADLYYSALDGNWNANANDLFAEAPAGAFPGDDADLLPELYVGRATVGNLTDANAYVVKVANYESSPPVSDDYPGSVLLLGEQLTSILDGADLCEETLTLVPPHLRVVRMYENHESFPGALPETKETVLDSLASGFGLVLHVGHGFHNTMSVGDGTLNNSDIDQLTNGARQSVLFAINCSSAAIDFSTIGERFLKNLRG